MNSNNVKIDNFVFDYFENINNSSDMKKTEQIFNILINYSYNFEYKILDKRMFTLHFTDEQLKLIKEKQKELGYENNLSQFVRYALFDFFIKEHNIELINNNFINELINYDKFKLLCDKCKDDVLNGKYTVYDLDLLRDNKKYEGKISFDKFNHIMEDEYFKIDFLEYDMLHFVFYNYENNGKVYSELIGKSTEQFDHSYYCETENGENLEPFTDYDNIVPDTDSFYYLLIYYVVIQILNDSEIDKLFDETEEHIIYLLEKYTFEKIIRYYERKYNINDIYKIFDEKCIEYLKSNSLFELDKIIESNEVIESNEIIEDEL